MARKRKVFHIITHFDLGGAERVAASIAKGAAPGTECHIVEVIRGRSAYTREFLTEMRAAGVMCHRAFVPEVHFHYLFERLAALLFPLWFVFLFIKHRPVAVHAHTEVPDMAACLFFGLFPRLAARCRLVRTIHNTVLWTGLKGTGRRVERFYARRGVSVPISQAVKDAYEIEWGRCAGIIYNGVEPVPQRPFADIAPQRINVLFAGRMTEQKGVSTMVEVVKAMEGDSRYMFYVVGGGPLSDVVRRRLGGQGNVRICGPVFGLPQQMGSFGYFFMPSEFEGFGLMSVEASLAGVPPLINNCPGLNETLPADWPLKVNGNSAEGYLHLLRNVIPRADRTALAAQARRFAETMFSVEGMRRGYGEYYI